MGSSLRGRGFRSGGGRDRRTLACIHVLVFDTRAKRKSAGGRINDGSVHARSKTPTEETVGLPTQGERFSAARYVANFLCSCRFQDLVAGADPDHPADDVSSRRFQSGGMGASRTQEETGHGRAAVHLSSATAISVVAGETVAQMRASFEFQNSRPGIRGLAKLPHAGPKPKSL